MIKKILKYVLGVGFLILLVYTFYYLYTKNQEPDVSYETTKATYQDIIKQTVATGSVVPRQEILIKPQVSGLIHKLYVEEGDKVKIGDLIAKIEIIPDEINLSIAENRVLSAEIKFENAELDFKRSKDLYENEVIAIAEYQDSELAY